MACMAPGKAIAREQKCANTATQTQSLFNSILRDKKQQQQQTSKQTIAAEKTAVNIQSLKD